MLTGRYVRNDAGIVFKVDFLENFVYIEINTAGLSGGNRNVYCRILFYADPDSTYNGETFLYNVSV